MSSAQQQPAQCACGLEERARRVLMVRRLHPAVTMQTLLQTFGVHGPVTGCKVFTHKSGRSAGCASLEFNSHQAACAALRALQGSLLHGKHIALQWFDQEMCAAAAATGGGTPAPPATGSSPAGRSPGQQRCELVAGTVSDGGGAARQLPAAQPHTQRGSCPGLSPFGMFAAAAPQPHGSSFCNASAAALAAAAAAAAVAAQQHPDQHGARHHQLPPLLVQELQRQASAPLGQLSPLGLHMPASPLTPASTAAGWEGLLSPVAAQHRAACQQQHLQQQEQQSRQQAAAWGQAGGCVNPAALAAAAMAATLQATPQQGQDMAASLQYANLQLAYAAAWQSQQQQPQQQQHAAAAAMLQQQLSGQLASSGVLGEHQLLGARSMPSDLSGLAAADAFLQQAAAAHNRQRAQQQQPKPNAASSSRGNAFMPSSGAGSYGSGTPSTPFAAHRHTLLAPDTGTSAGSSVSHADSCTGVPEGRHMDQASASACARRRSTGALAAAAAAGGAGGTHSGVKASDLQQQQQKQQLWGGDGILHKADRAPPSPAQQQQSVRRQSSHPLAMRGYSGSDDTAHPVPDVDSLAAGLAAVMRLQQQQQHNGDAGTASMPFPLSLAWNAAAQQASQLSPELLSALESAASAAASGGGCGSPLHSAVAAMQEQLLLAAGAGSAGGRASVFAQSQQQQQQQQHSTGTGHRQHSNSELLAAGQFARSFTSPGALTTTPFAGGGALDGVAEHAWQRQWGDAAGSGAAVASAEAFKQKHRMQLQLPAHAAAPVSAPLPACSMAGFQQRQAGSGVEQMLITTEVLPDSPVAHVPALSSSAGQRQQQQQQYGAGGSGGLDAAGVVGSSTAWADWSASMAALLSPAHVSSLAGRKFTDLLPLPSGVGQQQRSDGAGATSSSQAAWLLQQGSQRQSGVDALLAAADEDAASGLGKTRHASLCLDSRPGLFTLSNAAGQQASCAAGAGTGAGGGGGSFSFQPPTPHGTSLAPCVPEKYDHAALIMQPFQLPDFFSRCEGSRATGGSAPGCSSSSGRDAAAGSARSPLRPSAMEPEGLRLAEGSFSVDLSGACADAATARAGGLDNPTGRAPGSPLGAACAARNLQHSFSMPARFCSAPGGASRCDALAAAAAAAIADAPARTGGSNGGDGSAATAASQAPIW